MKGVKRSSIVLLLILLIFLVIGVYNKNNPQINMKIAIVTKDSSFHIDKNLKSLTESVNATVKKFNLNSSLLDKNSIDEIWIDLNTISDFSCEEIKTMNYLLDNGKALVFIKDDVNRNYLVNLLGIGEQYLSESKVDSNYVLQGIKLEKRDDLYVFTSLLISKDGYKNINLKYRSLL